MILRCFPAALSGVAEAADRGPRRAHIEYRGRRDALVICIETDEMGVPGHLSQDNNTPALALATHRRVLNARLPIFVAARYEASDAMEI